MGLITPQLICLGVVTNSTKITLSKLARQVKLEASTVSGIVIALKKKN